MENPSWGLVLGHMEGGALGPGSMAARARDPPCPGPGPRQPASLRGASAQAAALGRPSEDVVVFFFFPHPFGGFFFIPTSAIRLLLLLLFPRNLEVVCLLLVFICR